MKKALCDIVIDKCHHDEHMIGILTRERGFILILIHLSKSRLIVKAIVIKAITNVTLNINMTFQVRFSDFVLTYFIDMKSYASNIYLSSQNYPPKNLRPNLPIVVSFLIRNDSRSVKICPTLLICCYFYFVHPVSQIRQMRK